MSQNISHAVMSQRVEAHDSLDFFPTPPWATRALCEWEFGVSGARSLSVWEPACGAGDMARPLTEYFSSVHASDIHQHGGASEIVDFLWPNDRRADWIVTNPPFRLGEQFISTALERADRGVAMLVRIAFLESADRHRKLFSMTPPAGILQFVERVPMFKGRLDRHGSTATAYCWLVWRKGHSGETRFHWISPCRKRLERDGDYPGVAA
jgi:hypothetical protein